METFRVKNYKGLKDLELKGLSRVNLVIGRNNVGKSSLLEALSLCVSGGAVADILEILENNGEKVFRSSSLLRDERGQDNELPFLSLFHRASFIGRLAPEIAFTKDCDSVTIRLGYKKENISKHGSSVSRMWEYVSEEEYSPGAGKEGASAEKGIIIRAGESFQFVPFYSDYRTYSDTRERMCLFVRPADFMYYDAALYDQIAMSEKENKLISALRIIEPKIQRINYLESEPGSRKRVPFVVVGPNADRVRLSTMGDGINRILTIVLALLNCPAGSVLNVDEIDNGLHFSIQKKLWEMVFSLAHELDVQVFATTHSVDCLRSFAEASNSGDGLLIRLDARQNGSIVPQYYLNPEDIRYAVETQIELR